ncbi:DUF4178 domain-containing protein [Pararhodobacter zhoushanensis]|uniref:DUF4178 domain-containing protein n=1 Tax=Pararhodobacter zhoushanensis TaxID=2479545 RepID=A0ABT3H1T5_9RHOB|nr:DUF4178 domain-containing protein [Pararhodobacter zhoushanensis]MCW1933754.1 DUF4178 domain-containing protein [Pararhodobacter zhoushanensis]
MISCPYCGTTSFLSDKAAQATSGTGEMHEAPQLISLGTRVVIHGTAYLPIGHARFSYGRGEWDEYWVETDQGGPAWISVDEGDVAIQRAVEPSLAPTLTDMPFMGTTIGIGQTDYTVSEIETARCIALRGLFGEVLALNQTYRFVNCTGPRGTLLSGEVSADGWAWFLGRWVDPFRVRAA